MVALNEDTVAWSARPCVGELECGDAAVGLRPTPNTLLVAVVDGLGHGAEAAKVARAVIQRLQEEPGDDLVAMVSGCHEATRGGRGWVMTVARLSPGRVEWVGLGNVSGFVQRPDGSRLGLVGAAGIGGLRTPRLRSRTVQVGPDDLLVLATDGVQNGFELPRRGTLAARADAVLDRWARPTDDALLLLARMPG